MFDYFGFFSPQFSRPEFILLAGEAPVTLHLPGSIVVTTA